MSFTLLMSRASALLIFLSVLAFGQQPAAQTSAQDERDLRIQKDTAVKDAPVVKPAASSANSVSIPVGYAVVIGVANYQNLPAKNQLKYPERDAQSIYSTLISLEGGNFPPENVHLLVGSKATLANVRHEIEDWLPSVSKDNDRVLIYFAGHGFVDHTTGKAYLAPYDIDLEHVNATAYPMDALGHAISSKIKGKWKVLLTDSCHSGAISPGASESDDAAQKLNEDLSKLSPSLFSLTASRDREKSFEGAAWGGGHGVFTYYVVKGLQGEADTSGDGVVSADELADYVYRNVRDSTKTAQNPTFDKGSFDSNMLLAFVPSHVRPDAPPAPRVGTLLVKSNVSDVEVFVDGNSVGVLSRDKPLTLPGLMPGVHTVKGVKNGYEPDGPKEEMVFPGQATTVPINILIARRHSKAALENLDEGLKFYTKGNADNYQKAAEHFRNALTEDPSYSQAALYLGRTYNALFDEEQAKVCFQKAIAIDPDYVEAEASYAGMLLDNGDTDESIRQLVRATQRDPSYSMAYYLLAEAYRMKQAYPQSIEAAETAIRLTPNNAEAHFWLAESLRQSGQYDRSSLEYQKYLKLSDFDSKLAGNLNYYVLGYLLGAGRRSRAAQQDIWRDLRSLAYFGLCDAYRKQKNYRAAIQTCESALTYDARDPYTHYALGLALEYQWNATGAIGMLPAARLHFETMLSINPDLAEAEFARKNITNINKFLKDR